MNRRKIINDASIINTIENVRAKRPVTSGGQNLNQKSGIQQGQKRIHEFSTFSRKQSQEWTIDKNGNLKGEGTTTTRIDQRHDNDTNKGNVNEENGTLNPNLYEFLNPQANQLFNNTSSQQKRVFTSYNFKKEQSEIYIEFEARTTDSYFQKLNITNKKQTHKLIKEIYSIQKQDGNLNLQINEKLKEIENKLVDRLDIVERLVSTNYIHLSHGSNCQRSSQNSVSCSSNRTSLMSNNSCNLHNHHNSNGPNIEIDDMNGKGDNNSTNMRQNNQLHPNDILQIRRRKSSVFIFRK